MRRAYTAAGLTAEQAERAVAKLHQEAGTGGQAAVRQGQQLVDVIDATGAAATRATAAVAGLQQQQAAAPAAADTPTALPVTFDAAAAVAAVRQQLVSALAVPLPVSLNVAAAAAAAGQTVVAAIAAALAGASFSVPVTAVVTVDSGGATQTSGSADLSDAAAKRGGCQ